jgi:hypothetical protein
MVPFGDLRDVAPPFTVDCPVPGKSRWVDARTWAYDFDRDLPAGLRCVFTARPDLASLAGEPLDGETRFELSTGGPSIESAVPADGSERIDEQQAFVLALDGEATNESIVAHAGFEVDGVAERIGVDLIEGADRDAIVAGLPYWLKPDAPFVVVKARQTFPERHQDPPGVGRRQSPDRAASPPIRTSGSTSRRVRVSRSRRAASARTPRRTARR